MSDAGKPRLCRLPRLHRCIMGFIGLFDRWLHMSCRAFIRLVSEKYERPLSPGERVRHALHWAICRFCRIQERRMAHLRALAHEIGEDRPDDGDAELSADAIEKIRRAMAEASARTASLPSARKSVDDPG
ncbi:MAG: hypothetical protein HY899_10270 [Deltaproteobacteria bacterium]|nr:hypothetical protein [Deltaproteobacteria bacterium]